MEQRARGAEGRGQKTEVGGQRARGAERGARRKELTKTSGKII